MTSCHGGTRGPRETKGLGQVPHAYVTFLEENPKGLEARLGVLPKRERENKEGWRGLCIAQAGPGQSPEPLIYKACSGSLVTVLSINSF